jgi:deoxyribose-phosphate aldolase
MENLLSQNNELAKYIDLTLLKPDATSKEIKELARLAVEYKTGGLCIQPNALGVVKNILKDSGVLLVTVPNWIMGGGILPGKEYLLDYSKDADEVDYVVNVYQAYESKEYDKVEEEIRKVRQYAKVLKVIIESSYIRMTHYEERVQLTKKIIEIAEKAGADWIKTDSGLFKRSDRKVKIGESASITETAFEGLLDDVKTIMKYTKKPVKAAGGVRTKDQAEQLIKMGVKRIGSSSVKILEDTVVLPPDKY